MWFEVTKRVTTDYKIQVNAGDYKEAISKVEALPIEDMEFFTSSTTIQTVEEMIMRNAVESQQQTVQPKQN